jgi:hypothetical protein
MALRFAGELLILANEVPATAEPRGLIRIGASLGHPRCMKVH